MNFYIRNEQILLSLYSYSMLIEKIWIKQAIKYISRLGRLALELRLKTPDSSMTY